MTDAAPTDEELRRPPVSTLAVLGQPIAHSKSPEIHRAAYRRLGLPWTYEPIECDESSLESLLATQAEERRGFSLTMPLKSEARRLAKVVDAVAEESGVVNTLLRLALDSSGAPQWAGFNTDVAGLASALRRAGLDATRTIVLGSGATAVSAILAARMNGAQHIEIVARNTQSINELVRRFDQTAEPGGGPVRISGTTLADAESAYADSERADASLVISTLPGPVTSEVTLPAALLRVPLFDVAYDPWPSPLATRWTEAGGVAHAGIEMLVEQALVQIRIFVNGDPGTEIDDEDGLRAIMLAASVGG
ncbi:MAG: shikimate dehydrogenase family protein [Leucobacter sp.]